MTSHRAEAKAKAHTLIANWIAHLYYTSRKNTGGVPKRQRRAHLYPYIKFFIRCYLSTLGATFSSPCGGPRKRNVLLGRSAYQVKRHSVFFKYLRFTLLVYHTIHQKSSIFVPGRMIYG